MFSLLNPLALWLSPLVAAPLLIHLLGRARPKPVDFPSVMLVREKLARALRRHRLRNWLLLILRTLLMICLFLAAGNPVWRSKDAWAPPAAAGILIHNGAYGQCPGKTGSLWDAQIQLKRGLDTLTSGHAHMEPLLPGLPPKISAARFGPANAYAEAIGRLLRAEDSDADYHVFIPVFD